MTHPFSIIRSALKANQPSKQAKHWRDSLRQRLGKNGEVLHQILTDLAEGRAWMVELPDGRCSAPILPSSDVRLRAAMFLHETLFGKSVAQTEIQKAEVEAKEFESIRALNDEELEVEASRILAARRVQRLSPTNEVAEYIASPEEENEKDERAEELADRIWTSTPSEDQE